jgi:hypothetical protein
MAERPTDRERCLLETAVRTGNASGIPGSGKKAHVEDFSRVSLPSPLGSGS